MLSGKGFWNANTLIAVYLCVRVRHIHDGATLQCISSINSTFPFSRHIYFVLFVYLFMKLNWDGSILDWFNNKIDYDNNFYLFKFCLHK